MISIVTKTYSSKRPAVLSLLFYLSTLFICLSGKPAIAQHEAPDSLLIQAAKAIETKQFHKAIYLLNRFPDRDDQTHFQPQRAKALQLLSEAYNKLGNKEKAYEYFERYRFIKDSLFSLEKNKMISQLKTDYETEKKDRKIAEQQLLLKKDEVRSFRKQLIIWGGIITGMLVLLLCFFSLAGYRKKQKITKKIREQMQHNYEIQQIEAHINGTIEEHKRIALHLQQNAYPVIGHAANILKDLQEKDPVLGHSESFSETCQILNVVKKDMDKICRTDQHEDMRNKLLSSTLKAFIDNIPQSRDLNISFNYTGTEIPLPGVYVLHLTRIVQELVQNVIKHAAATEANVQLKYTAEQLTLLVADNGKGFMHPVQNQGMGLKNIKERLDTLKGRMMMEQVQGTRIRIVIPLDAGTGEKS